MKTPGPALAKTPAPLTPSSSHADLHEEKGDGDETDERSGGKSHAKRWKKKRKRAEIFITMHVAKVIQRHEFLLKLARSLMMFGAPSHRLEAQISSTAHVLETPISCFYLPGVMLISFDDNATSTSNVKIVKQAGGLDLGKLLDTYAIYWEVIHDRISVTDASKDLDVLMRTPELYRGYQTVLLGGLCSAFIAPIAFQGSFVDALISFPLGAFLVFVQNVSRKNQLYSNVFEITIATILSFLAAALASTHVFCYAAVASSAVVTILPGYMILCGSLELASRSITAGAVRLCYAVIYSLFLGFGISIGAEIYHQVSGQYIIGSSDYTCAATHTPDSPWYKQTPSIYWAFLAVPMYSFLLSLRNQTPWWRKELYITTLIGCGGWVANYFSSKQFVGRGDLSSALGSFVIGIIGNLYGRLFNGNAFVVMITGILFQLPSALSNGGLLTLFSQSPTTGAAQTYSQGFQIAQQLVSAAIGLTVGLFVSAVVVHPFGGGKKRGHGLFSL